MLPGVALSAFRWEMTLHQLPDSVRVFKVITDGIFSGRGSGRFQF